MRQLFFWTATSYAVFLWIVTLSWVVVPSMILAVWNLPADDAGFSIGLRVGGLTFGWGLALFLARRQPPSPARRAISYGSAAANLAAALGGVYSFWTGLAGVGILLPVVIEVATAIAFLLAERAPRNPITGATQEDAASY